MDRETTMSNGTRVMMNGKMIMKDGMLDGKMMEGEKDVKMEGMGK